MRGRLKAIGVLGAVVAMAAGCSGSATSMIGTVADSGFRPAQNGLPFRNYGTVLSDGDIPINLTAADVQKMFGDNVCTNPKARTCTLIPEAEAWLDETNREMAGGHCYGFSVLAELLWQRKVIVSTLGAAHTSSLDIDNNKTLQRLIAYDWALQTLNSVQSKRITGTPNEILTKLQEVLKPHPAQTYTIAFWKRDGEGGHAVTPYAVENKGGGKFKVLIYDNNWPGQTRAISFDTNTETWTYDAATNPNQPDSVYEGDAKSKTISLFPTTPGLGIQPCPFCATVSTNRAPSVAEGDNMEEIYLQGGDANQANLIVTDEAGRRLGYLNDSLINQIPGARVDEVISNPDWTNKMDPSFFVPADVGYTITLDGTALATTDTETVGIIAPSYDLSVDSISVHPGDTDTLAVEPDATHLSYTSSRSQSTSLELGVSDSRADYSFRITGVSDQPGSTLNVGLPAEGDSLTLQNVGSGLTSTVNLEMTRSTHQGSQIFSHQAVPLASGDTAALLFGTWNGPNHGIPLVTTHEQQQVTQTLADQSNAP